MRADPRRRTLAVSLAALLLVGFLAAGVPLTAVASGNHELTHDPMDTSTGEPNGVRSEFLVVNADPAVDFGPTTSHALEIRQPATGDSVVVESAPGEEQISFGQATLRLYEGDGSIRLAPRIETPSQSQLVTVSGDRAMFEEGDAIGEYEVSLLNDSNGDGTYDEVISTTATRELGTNYEGGIEQDNARGNVTVSFPVETGAGSLYAEFELLDGDTVVVGPTEMTADGGQFTTTFNSTELADGVYTGRVSLYETSDANVRVVGGWETDIEVRNDRGGVEIEHGPREQIPSDRAYAQWLTAELSAPVSGDTIEFEIRNLDTGEAVRVVPEDGARFPSGTPLVFRANTDQGELNRPPSILVGNEEIPASFDPVEPGGTVTNPFEPGDARYEIVLLDGDTPLDATGPRAHLIDYTHDIYQDSQSGEITVSIRRGVVSENYTAELDSDVPADLTYDSSGDQFVGSFDSTELDDGEYHWTVRFVNESAPNDPPLANVTSEAYGEYTPIIVDNGVIDRTTPVDDPEGDTAEVPTATATPSEQETVTVPMQDANDDREGTTVLVDATPLSEVTFHTDTAGEDLTVSSLDVDGPARPPGTPVYRFDIDVAAALENESATLAAIVDPADLAAAGGTAENLTFYRYTGDEWTRLDSRVTELPTGYRVSAETPGFSQFAVVSNGQVAEEATPTPTPSPTTAAPVETATPSPTPTQDDGTGFGVGAALFALLAAFLLGRR